MRLWMSGRWRAETKCGNSLDPSSAVIQGEVNHRPSWLGGGGDAGVANGGDATLQRKRVKRSRGNEAAAPPVPLMRRKEGPGNSDPEQPGKAQDLGKTVGKVRFMSTFPLLVSFLNNSTVFFITLRKN